MLLLVILLVVFLIIALFQMGGDLCRHHQPREHFGAGTFHEIEKIGEMKEINAFLDDITFKDVVVYENDLGPDPRLGLDKCLERGDGHCVAYGPTGVAYYFPPPPPDADKYYGQLVNLEPTQRHFDTAGTPRTPGTTSTDLEYPAFR